MFERIAMGGPSNRLGDPGSPDGPLRQRRFIPVAAWWCANAGTMQGGLLADVDLMGEVSAYNEVDCRVMMEAVGYLRGRLVSGL